MYLKGVSEIYQGEIEIGLIGSESDAIEKIL